MHPDYNVEKGWDDDSFEECDENGRRVYQIEERPSAVYQPLILRDEVYAVIGAAIEVHRELGLGFLESVYQEALEVELAARKIPFEPQKLLEIHYKGIPLKKNFFADLVCYDKIIVELKAIDQLSGREEAQLLHYLKAAGIKVGLLINFGSPGKLEWKRLIR